jgi:hypothetical protein
VIARVGRAVTCGAAEAPLAALIADVGAVAVNTSPNESTATHNDGIAHEIGATTSDTPGLGRA